MHHIGGTRGIYSGFCRVFGRLRVGHSRNQASPNRSGMTTGARLYILLAPTYGTLIRPIKGSKCTYRDHEYRA